MKQKISSDKPVALKSQDRFQRYDFSKRVAEKIVNSTDNDSIVIGIYGAWGEGKTSVINFIETELETYEDIIPIRFNPWRFTEEATLLVSFFNKLALEVKKSFPEPKTEKNGFIERTKKRWNDRKEPLKTNKETIGDIIEKYGKIVSIFGAGEAAESVGKVLSNVDIETLKERFEKLLLESNKKIVIFIDDIDRLDKQEIHAIFRLVKLTADFSNTIYILSFDQEMVASAIGERFGQGDKQAGLNFLEKIIQVPLKIPQAQPDALKQYCFELVDIAINDSGISLSKDDVQRFVSEFVGNVLLRLSTPRLAVRYGNTLSFSFPLLKGEVNMVDLMLVESLKIFYPNHYEFLKQNSNYFLASYDSFYSRYTDDKETRKKELQEHLETLGKVLSKREKEAVLSLLKELFPRLKEALDNTFYHRGPEEWYKEKRIVSPDYFKRYFSYAVLKGEISDAQFDSFISTVKEKSQPEIIESFKRLIESSSTNNFLHKIRSLEEDLDWQTSKKLALSIGQSGDIFPEDHSVFNFGFDQPNSQAAIFIYHLIKKHDNQEEKLELAIELMKTAQPFEFAQNINYWLRSGTTEDEKTFNIEEYNTLALVSIERALEEAGDTPIFEKFQEPTWYLLESWSEIQPKEFDKYIKNILSKNPLKVKTLIEAFTPEVRSTSHPAPYKSNFKKEHYDRFKQFFDKDFIFSLIMENYGEEINKESVQFNDFENIQTGINILRQYKHWYENENEVTIEEKK